MPGPGSEVALFSIAYRFADFDAAGRAYEQSRDLIFAADLNASTYRVVLNGITHVVVIGEDVPFPTLQQALPEICEEGELADVPDEIVLTLALRRAQVSGPHVQFERRYDP